MDCINTLKEFMFRTESITNIMIFLALVFFPLFWRFLTERDEE